MCGTGLGQLWKILLEGQKWHGSRNGDRISDGPGEWGGSAGIGSCVSCVYRWYVNVKECKMWVLDDYDKKE